MPPPPHHPSFPPSPPRRTLARAASVTGHTLFSGITTTVAIRPASARTGIAFRRTDIPDSPPIPAVAERVTTESRRTVLAQPGGDPRVETVEHLLSALIGLGVTDALVDVNGPEIPIGDGSALPFAEAVRAASVVSAAETGSLPQDHAASPLVIAEQITVEAEGAHITALPPQSERESDSLILEYQLDYGPHPHLKPQRARLRLAHDVPPFDYLQSIAPARTFCLEHEAREMRELGLFEHLEPRDMLVIGDHGPIDNTYRFPDEPARHKLLDLLGDLALAARPIYGRITAVKSGHALNHRLARALREL